MFNSYYLLQNKAAHNLYLNNILEYAFKGHLHKMNLNINRVLE